MIGSTLELLRTELQHFVAPIAPSGEDTVTLGNIAFMEDTVAKTQLQNRLVLSLVNLEEESVFKNNPVYRRVNGKENPVKANPPVHINLFLLVSSYFPEPARYRDSLRYLSRAVEFFQGKNVFHLHNIQTSISGNWAGMEEILSQPDFRIIIDLYTLTFEQINHLWGALGGKQIPFAMYKCRLIKIDHGEIMQSAPLIEQVDGEDEPIPST